MSVVQQLTELYEAKYDDLVRIYKSRAGENDVEDVVQEAFYRALYYKDSFNPTFVSLENWLTSIMNNCLRDMLRERRDGSAMHDSEHEPAIDDRCPSDKELELKILADIEREPEHTKNVLWLYFVMGHKPDEIQKVLGGSPVAIRVRVCEFRNYCHAKYGHLMED